MTPMKLSDYKGMGLTHAVAQRSHHDGRRLDVVRYLVPQGFAYGKVTYAEVGYTICHAGRIIHGSKEALLTKAQVEAYFTEESEP